MAERMLQQRLGDDKARALIRTAPTARCWRLRTSAMLVAAAFGAGSSGAFANPQGAKVVSGSATITNSGSTLVIKNTPGAIINWQSFSIGAGETTNFIQQSVNSAILNRVVGVDPSVILGTLTSNGHVYLVNPNGVVFGKGAMVDAAGLVVSSLDITDQDFKNGTLRFVGSDASGSISVAGVLRSSDGDVYLIAPNVTNSGSITAVNGSVTLAAGQDVQILGNGLTDIAFNVQNKGNTALNLGQINGDAVGIFAGTITQAGGVSATTATVAGGKVILSAASDVTLAAGSITSANNPAGTAGAVTIQSATGNISVAPGASVSASGASGGMVTLQASAGSDTVTGSVAATGTLGLAGITEVLGSSVLINSGAVVDASGATGGGQIIVGGQSKFSNLLQSQTTTVAQGANLIANATDNGNGGDVSVYGGQFMRMDGSISAQGGSAGGNGGFVETSGDAVAISGAISAGARNRLGKAGGWLLDPDDVIIDNTSGTSNPSHVSATTITNSLDSGVNVTVATSTFTGGPAVSDFITVNSPINPTAFSGSPSLTLSAGGAININAPISAIGITAGGAFTLNLSANLDGSTGAVSVTAPIYIPGGSVNVFGSDFLNSTLITASNFSAITSSTFNNASGTIQAGAIANGTTNGGSVNVQSSGSVQSGNITADSSGGSSGTIAISSALGVMINGNLSVDDVPGGGAAGNGGTLTIIGSQISSSPGITIVADAGGGSNAAGNGGSISLFSTAGSITLTNALLSADGGTPLSVGNGGAGGSLVLTTTGGALALSGGSFRATGGQGASGTTAGSDGGNGGTFSLTSDTGIVFSGASVHVDGGAGSSAPGGTGVTYPGGTGGQGGSITFTDNVNGSGFAMQLINPTLSANGGVGGAGSLSTQASDTSNVTAGSGGVGGGGGRISLNGSGGMQLSGVVMLANGGSGGSGGNIAGPDASAFGGTGGAGGLGGQITIEDFINNISIGASDLIASGGNGGHGGAGIGLTGGGGPGGSGGSTYGSGSYPISLVADTGSVSIDAATSLVLIGGAGGAGGNGYLNSLATGFGQAGDGGAGGNPSGIEIYGHAGLAMGGTIQILGGSGGAGGTIGSTDSDSGFNHTAGSGGAGGSVLAPPTSVSLSAFTYGALTSTATISIVGGAGGNGGQGLDTNVVPGAGGNGGAVADYLSFSGENGVSIGGSLTVAGGQGGSTTANLLPPTPLVSQAGNGGSVPAISVASYAGGISISGPISYSPGAGGAAYNGGLAGVAGGVSEVDLSAPTGAITETGAGAILGPGHLAFLLVNASGASVSLTGDNQIDYITGTAYSGDFNIRSLVNLSATNALSMPGNIILTAAGSSVLQLDGELDSGGNITLSGGGGILALGSINATAGSVSLTGGSLTLNGNSVSAGTDINISVAGSLATPGSTLTAAGYYLNAGGSVGVAGAPIALSPNGFAYLGGSAGGNFYVDASGDLLVAAGSGLGISAAGIIQIGSIGFVNYGVVQGAEVTLNQSYEITNVGSLGASGTMVLNAPFVTTAGELAGSSITISADSEAFLSGAIAAQGGNLVIDSSAVQIGFNSHSTSIGAQDISISAGSLTVSPDNGSGYSTGTGNALVEISAAGTLTVTTTGDATFAGGAESGAYVSVISTGNSTYNIGGNLNLSGGSGIGSYALLDPTSTGSVMNVNATNVLLQGGTAMGAYAAISSAGNMIINAPNGSVMLSGGSATDSDAVLISSSGGMVTLNTPSCINCSPVSGNRSPIGDGATESGVYTVSAAAPPPPAAPPSGPAPAPAPGQMQFGSQPLDEFVNDIVTLLSLPVTALTTTPDNASIYIDGAADGCI